MEAGAKSAGEPTLRERKKRRTRAAIAEAALELFWEHGFQETTIREVAEAADVAPRTVWSYFPTKEDLVFPDHAELREQLERRLAERAEGATAIDTLREWIAELLADERGYDAKIRQLQLIEREPALRGHERLRQAELEDILAAAVAVDLDVAPDALVPHMVAAATTAALDRLRPPDPADRASRDEALALVDDAMTFVGAGVRGLQHRRR